MTRPSPAGKLFVLLLLSSSIVGTATGCRRSHHVEGTVSTDAALQAFTDIGYDTEAVKVVEPEPWSAGACSQGTISGLDVLVCEYATDDALAKGEQKINEDWNTVNVGTGVVVHTARTLMAVADSKNADPSGRAIARLLGAFRELH
jgi:hypothetical protein